MVKKICLFFIILIFGGIMLNAADNVKKELINKNISPKDAMKLISDNKENKNFIILDVRTPDEFNEEHIAKALNIDFHSEKFIDDLKNLDKTKKILIYCRSGNRSGKALKIMKDLAFQEVYNVEGGTVKWKSEKLPLVK